jgi:hypothetical protein
MTNLFRRGLVASLLMDGEAWNQPLALKAADTQSDHWADHVVEDGMLGRQGGLSGETWR